MNASAAWEQRALTHATLRFAFVVTAALVIGESLRWWPSFLAAVLAAVLLAGLPGRLTLRMGVGMLIVMAVVAGVPYIVATLLRGVPFVLFGLVTLAMLLTFNALLIGRPKLPAILLLICLAVIPVVVLTAPAQALLLPWALVRGMGLALVLILLAQQIWPAAAAQRPAAAAAKLRGSPFTLAVLSTAVLLPILLAYLLFGLLDALPVIVTTVMLVINFDPAQSARHALALILGNLIGGLLGWCLYLVLLTTPNLLFLSMLLLTVLIPLGRGIAKGGPIGAVALVACNAALIIFGSALAAGPVSSVLWLTRLVQFALAGAFALSMMHLLWRCLPAPEAARTRSVPTPTNPR